MDQLEVGFYSAVVAYGLIVIWTLLDRLSWLPPALVKMVRRPLNVFERVPILGQAMKACRKHALSLGSVPAILIGAAAPYAVLSVMWLGYWLSFAIAIILGAWAFVSGGDGEVAEADPYDMYVEKSGHGLAYGDSPRADVDRPLH